jgi:glycosyltransferase involved in cell wall biosynthesis
VKKILIVNNNLDIGGIQKALINLLRGISDKYEVTLMLFSPTGELMGDVPENVKVITPKRKYRMLGLTKEELKRYPALFLFKAFLVKLAKKFGRRRAMKILGLFQKKIKGYDAVFSYTHLSHHKYFWNGAGDFVLDKTVSDNKICVIHCDYINSGCLSEENNREYAEFDKIACCSDSVKKRFMEGSGISADKLYTQRNFFELGIVDLANESPYEYDEAYINLLTVARLSNEKGIDRVIECIHKSGRTDLRYYLVGGGPWQDYLLSKVKEYSLEDKVFFLGEQKNPYRFMINADYLVVSSYHEAAPVVFDEAKILGLPVITTETTSAREMISEEYGVVCENSTEGIQKVISEIKKGFGAKGRAADNLLQTEQFFTLIEK